MTTLAIHGGKAAVSEPLPRFNTIGREEAQAAHAATFVGPLSGFLGGKLRGGYYVERLEEEWAGKFGVKHAVSCNSATSGILIACMAIGVKNKTIRTTPYTMSGTVAPAVLLGANILFGDIDPKSYCLILDNTYTERITITVNLFGHPSDIPAGCVIEDASQSIMSTRNGKLIHENAAVTVFSGNVHKQIQCGEGGMCCTNDESLAHDMYLARNHWELSGYPAVGLNLRLSEVHAAIWREQLKKADKIIARKIEIAEQLSEMAKDLGRVPIVKPGCKHSYYIWSLKCRTGRSHVISEALKGEGVPVHHGYVTPLYRLPAFQQNIRRGVVEETNDNILIYENCAWDPSSVHLKQISEAFKKVTDAIGP